MVCSWLSFRWWFSLNVFLWTLRFDIFKRNVALFWSDELFWISTCWWKKSCTTLDVWNPSNFWDIYHINCRIFSINRIFNGNSSNDDTPGCFGWGGSSNSWADGRPKVQLIACLRLALSQISFVAMRCSKKHIDILTFFFFWGGGVAGCKKKTSMNTFLVFGWNVCQSGRF